MSDPCSRHAASTTRWTPSRSSQFSGDTMPISPSEPPLPLALAFSSTFIAAKFSADKPHPSANGLLLATGVHGADAAILK